MDRLVLRREWVAVAVAVLAVVATAARSTVRNWRRGGSKVYICSPRSPGMDTTQALLRRSFPLFGITDSYGRGLSALGQKAEGVESSPPPRDTPHRTPPYQRREVSLLFVV